MDNDNDNDIKINQLAKKTLDLEKKGREELEEKYTADAADLGVCWNDSAVTW